MERECSKLASHLALEVQQIFEKHMSNSPIMFLFLLLRQIVTKKNGRRGGEESGSQKNHLKPEVTLKQKAK